MLTGIELFRTTGLLENESRQYMFRLILFTTALFISACSEESYTNITPEQYQYQKPVDLSDGIETASLDEVNASEQPFVELVQNILRGYYKEIDSILVYQNDKLILEEYFNGYHQNKIHDLRSATKSITSLLTGIAVEQGFINSIDESVLGYFENDYSSFKNQSQRKQEMTIRDFLNMASGLDCDDDDHTSPGNEEKMYRFRDWYKFILDFEVINEPGDVFSYCTGGVNLLGGVIRQASQRSIHEFSNQYLFSKLGVDNFHWTYAPNLTEDTGGHLFLRPRDMLKIGIMFLKNGIWQDRRIVSEDWITLSKEKYFLDYGYLWWKYDIHFDESVGLNPAPHIEASGNGGQKIMIFPDYNAVIVFTGSNFGSFWGGYGPRLMLRDYILPNLPNNG